MSDRPLVVHIDSKSSALGLERKALEGIDCEIVSVPVSSEGDIIEAIKNATIVLDDHSPINASVVAQLERCRLIVRYGHGYDTVDLEACTAAGIMVTNIAGSTSEEVSNHALSLLLALARDLKRLDRAVNEGRWTEVYSRSICDQVYGRTVGVIGFGWIGRAFARKCRVLGMEVLVHDPNVGNWLAVEYGVRFVPFEELLCNSDYVSLHVPNLPSTHHMMNRRTFSLMKEGARLINTARGPIVDQAALVDMLDSKRLSAAAIDVFEFEPIDTSNPLLGRDNVIVTPHVAGSSEIGWQIIRSRAGEEAARVLRGERPNVLVNPEVLGRLTPA